MDKAAGITGCPSESKARINSQSARDRNQKPESTAKVRAIGIKSPNQQPKCARSESKARINSQSARNHNQKPESTARVHDRKARVECQSAQPETKAEARN
jgi:hypothetical protein